MLELKASNSVTDFQQSEFRLPFQPFSGNQYDQSFLHELYGIIVKHRYITAYLFMYATRSQARLP